MKQKFKTYFKEVTKLTSELSTCICKQVGAVLVHDNRVLAISYNGVPSGKKHCNKVFSKRFDREKHHEWSILNELHAEANLIAFCCREGIKVEGTILFTGLSPCISCTKLLTAVGISEVYYIEEYDKDSNGINFLKENNINIKKL